MSFYTAAGYAQFLAFHDRSSSPAKWIKHTLLRQNAKARKGNHELDVADMKARNGTNHVLLDHRY